MIKRERKSEIRNPKLEPNPNGSNIADLKTYDLEFGRFCFEIGEASLFRMSIFGFADAIPAMCRCSDKVIKYRQFKCAWCLRQHTCGCLMIM